MKEYTQQELNEILLTKTVEDLYFIKSDLKNNPTEKISAEELLKAFGDSKEVQALQSTLLKKQNEVKNDDAKNKTHFITGRFVVKIDDRIYDIISSSFIDLNEERIVYYEKLSNHFSNQNCRIVVYKPEDLYYMIKDPIITIQFYSDEAMYYFDKIMLEQTIFEDKTEEFKKEIGLNDDFARSRYEFIDY